MRFKQAAIALALASAILSIGTTAAAPAKPQPLNLQPSQTIALHGINPLIGEDGKAGVMIILKGEPATHAYARALGRSGNGPVGQGAADSAARDSIAKVKSAQGSFMSQLHSSGVAYQELFRVQRVLNGIAVRMQPSDMQKVRNLPNVERVAFLPVYSRPDNIASVPFVDAPQVWDGYNALALPFNATGKGVKIGDIDTGLDYVHPDFGGAGTLAAYQDIDSTSLIGKNSHNIIFPTNKVAGGYDFAGDAYNASNSPVPDANPMDCGGHGTHTAGTLAGVGVNADGTPYGGVYNPTAPYLANLKIGPGVAPEATLYALRVFGCGGSTNLVTAAIEWATDPNNDGNLSDHLDVINMSLGSNFGVDIGGDFNSDVEAVNNAALAGLISVSAAGNAGDTTFIASAPGAAKSGLMVAASVDPSVPGVLLTETAQNSEQFPATASVYTNPSNPQPPVPANQSGNVVLVNDTSGGTHQFCTTISNAAAVAGNFALIDRGGCNFTVKVQNAQAAGATGVIMIDNSGSPIPIAMGGAATLQITIPGISVSTASGAVLKTELAGNPVLATTMTAANAGDTLASFSSRGPVTGANGVIEARPDLAAPGLNIPSAQTGFTCTASAQGCITPNASGFLPGGQVLTISGTSMATPHVAGMMALLRQLNPTMSVEELKALAMNNASHAVTLGANGVLPTFESSRIGTGRIDAARAATGTLQAYNADDVGSVAVTFDVEPVGNAFSATHNVTLSNLASTEASVTLAVTNVLATPGVSYSVPGGTIVIPAHSSTSVEVTLHADASQMKWTIDPTMGPTQASTALGATLIRQFMSESSSLLKVLDSTSNDELARVQLYAAPRPHSTMATAGTLGSNAPLSGTTNLALSGTDVCGGTLGAGPSCTTAGRADEESLVSAFELQVSASPDATLPGWANLRYVGVNSDAANVYFGIATWGKWGTPTYASYNVCVDTNNDGLFDRVLANTDGGTIDQLFGLTTASEDTFVGMRYNNVSGALGVGFYLNLATANQADTGVFNNNTMILASSATGLGLGTTFHYGVAVCPGYNPLCGAQDWDGGGQGTAHCGVPGSSYASFNGPYVYNRSAPGVDGAGNVLNDDLNGGVVDVAYNVNNLVANGSNAMLLLHTHNTASTSAQVVVLDSIFQNGFDD